MYDGSIRIDTKIDSGKFDRGIKSMIGSLRGLAAAVGIAFGVGAIVAFGRSAVQEASAMSSALIGLQSIVEGTGNSFAVAQKFIDEFVSDGLIPAQNAITAYKNLLARGYNVEQIEQTLIALKDAASFGRQASLTMGQAVQSATEGLKNENSILVDNAGVTKNVSKMWQEYAASIGTTVNNLTQAQKIQAEVNGIMEESRFQVGDAAKLAGTYAGQVSALGVSFLNLKIAVGNVIIPILAQIIPYIKAAVDALTIFFNRLAQIMNILFGTNLGMADAEATASTMGAVADSTNDAAAAQDNLASSTKKANKEAKGSLAAFDELNVLQQQQAIGDAGGAGGSGAGGGIGAAGGGMSIPPLDVKPIDESMDELKAKVSEWKESFLLFIQPTTDALGRLKEALIPLGQTLWSGLKWAWDNILVPLGGWAITDLLPAFLDALSAALEVLNLVLLDLEPIWKWIWDNMLEPIAKWTGGAIVEVWNSITWAFKRMSEMLKDNKASFYILIGIIAVLVIALLSLGAPIWAVVAAIIAIIAIIKNWGAIWDWVKEKSAAAWAWIKATWSKAGDWFRTTVVDPIKDGFGRSLDWLREKWQSTFTGIKDFVKSTVNTIIDFINGMIRAVAGGINAVIGGLNSIRVTVPNWVPGFGGQSWGMSLPSVYAPQIPRLATGAVIPPNSEFLAMLGDQRSGRNIEAPENLLRQIVSEEIGKIEADIKIGFTGSMSALVRELKPRIDRESVRVGGSLIAGAAKI